MCKCTYESRRNWQSGTIRIPRSIQFILCYQPFDCPRLCFFRSWQVRSFPSTRLTRLTSGHSIVDNPTLFPTRWSHESFKWHHANCNCWNSRLLGFLFDYFCWWLGDWLYWMLVAIESAETPPVGSGKPEGKRQSKRWKALLQWDAESFFRQQLLGLSQGA